MKVADLVAELNFKVSGLDDLTKMDNQMKSIASNARDAVIALRQLARVQLPKQFIPQAGARGAQGALPRGAAALAGLVPTGSAATGNAGSMIRSANILVQSARIVVQEGSFGGGGGKVIPPAGGAGGPSGWNGGLGPIGKLLGIATIYAAIRGLVSGLKDMIQTSRAASFANDKLTASTGINLKELAKWNAVATRVGLSNGTVEGALSTLTQKKADLENGVAMNTTPYSYLGIDWRADAGTQLRQFFQSTQGRTVASAKSAAEMLGIDPSLVHMRDQLDRSGNPPELPEGTELTKSQQAATMQLNSAWQDMIFNTSALANKITADLSPALREVISLINSVERFFIGNDDARKLIFSPTGTMDLGAIKGLLPTFSGNTTSATIHNEVNVTNHGTVSEVLKTTGKTVVRSISDAMYGVHPAFSDR